MIVKDDMTPPPPPPRSDLAARDRSKYLPTDDVHTRRLKLTSGSHRVSFKQGNIHFKKPDYTIPIFFLPELKSFFFFSDIWISFGIG